jgi:hypothetical protein
VIEIGGLPMAEKAGNVAGDAMAFISGAGDEEGSVSAMMKSFLSVFFIKAQLRVKQQ